MDKISLSTIEIYISTDEIRISTHQNALLQAQNAVFYGREAPESYEKRLELTKDKVSAVKIEPQRHKGSKEHQENLF